MSKQYILDTDDDSHWFVIPADKEQEWSDWLDAMSSYERKWFQGLVGENDSQPPQPEWAEAVGGAPSRVKFKEYKIE
jgi:hypothetical protein